MNFKQNIKSAVNPVVVWSISLMLLLIGLPRTSRMIAHANQFTVYVIGSTPMKDAMTQWVNDDPELRAMAIRVESGSRDRLLTHLAEGHAADVFVFPSPVNARDFLDLDYILPLDDIIARDINLNDSIQRVYPAPIEAVQWRGRQIGVPLMMSVNVMAANQFHLDDLGLIIADDWTWHDFQHIAGKLTVMRKELPERLTVYRDGLEHFITHSEGAVICDNPICWLPFIWSNDGDYYDPANQIPLIDQPASRDALQWLQEMTVSGALNNWVAATEEGLVRGYVSLAPASIDMMTFFTESLAPLMMQSPPESTAKSGWNGVIGYPFPRSMHTGKSVLPISPVVVAINKDTTNESKAIAFLTRLISRPLQERVALHGFPVRNDITFHKYADRVSPALLREAGMTGRNLPPPFIGDAYVWSYPSSQFASFFAGQLTVDDFVEGMHDNLTNMFHRLDESGRAF